VPGVGKKTAARLLVELKSRLDVPDSGFATAAVTAGRAAGNGSGAGESSARADVRTALAGLGYTPDEIRNATADLPDDGDAAELLRQALSALAAGR
jgi:Holliday junction DNA helicase RuvA